MTINYTLIPTFVMKWGATYIIIKNEQEFTAWKSMEVDDSYKAFNTEEFNCKGKWIDVCKKTYDDQMSYYLDPKNAPVANQAFADGFRMGMDYMVP